MNISEALDLSPQELVQRSDDEGGGSFVSRCADLVSAVIRLLEIELQTAGGTVKFTEDQEPGERDTVDARPTCVHGEDGTLVVDGLRRKFDGGTIVFHPDRVELCGATICGGARAGRQRKVLDLLRLKNADGQFKAYSSKSLAQNVGVKDGNSAAGLIRDLRARISKSLLEQVGIDCGLDEVILSGNQGYRFPEKLSVQENDGSEGTCLHSHDAASALDRDPDDSDRDKGHDSDGDPNRDCDDSDYDSDRELVPDSGSSSPEARQEWIVGELREGTKLKAPMIADELKCSIETVRRDLDVLKAAGKIEYVGSARSGHYRLTDGG